MTHKKMTRRQLLQGLGALGVATLVGCAPRLYKGELRENGEENGTGLPDSTACAEPLGAGWNFIIVVLDSLRRDHVGYFGRADAQTPNVDAFAAESLVFDRAFIGGFPTLLNRAELFAGRHTFIYMDWEDLAEENVLAEALGQAGYATAIIFDTWHLKAEDRTYDRGFGYSQWIRGQEGDPYMTTPSWPTLPASDEKLRHAGDARQYLRNVSERQGEEDYFVAKTMRAAIAWLRQNHNQGPFYLHVDSFDPHEPWDPPQSYVDLYDPGYTGEVVFYPAYAPPDYMTVEELNHMRALYAAEVTMVDHWAGEFIKEIKALGLWENTVIFLLSDHGVLLGEHNAVGKSWDYLGHRECYPLYKELAHVPFMLHVPGMGHRRIADLAQPVDVMPTILEWAGVAAPDTVQGTSLVPVVEDLEGASHTPPRLCAASSRSLKVPLAMLPRCTITDGEWTLIYGGEHASSALYHLPDDPWQRTDLLAYHCDPARALHAEWVTLLETAGAHDESIDPWRTPPC